jgi:hypothetical protein
MGAFWALLLVYREGNNCIYTNTTRTKEIEISPDGRTLEARCRIG